MPSLQGQERGCSIWPPAPVTWRRERPSTAPSSNPTLAGSASTHPPLRWADVVPNSTTSLREPVSGTPRGCLIEEVDMADSVYRVTDVIGVSSESWEAAARNAVKTAAKTIRDLRVAEVIRTDVTIENGKVSSYRVRLGISFKYEEDD